MNSASRWFFFAAGGGSALVLLLVGSSVRAQSYTLSVLDDAMIVYSGDAEDNFGGRDEFILGIDGGSARNALLRFDVTAAAAEISNPAIAVVEATLILNPRDQRANLQGAGSAQIGVFGLVPENAGWREGTRVGSASGISGQFGSVSSRFLSTPSSMSTAAHPGLTLPDPKVDTDGTYWHSLGGGPTGTPLTLANFDVATDTTNVVLGQADTADLDIVSDADWRIVLDPIAFEPFLTQWLETPDMEDPRGGTQAANAGLVLTRISGASQRWFFEANEGGRPNQVARLELLFGPRPVPGDVDGDGLTNSADFEIIRQNFWQTFEDRTEGDLVNNDFVDFADYAQWKQAPKDADPLGAASQAVPEPSTLMLLAGALLFGIRRRV